MPVIKFCHTGACAQLPPREKKRAVAMGMCSFHYERDRQRRLKSHAVRNGILCSVEGCGAPATKAGKCNPCYDRAREPLRRARRLDAEEKERRGSSTFET